jgi:hypothetical protein
VSPETPTGSAAQPGHPGGAFCFRLKQERPGWNVLLPIPAKTIVDLAALVREVPEFLSMDGGGAPCRAAVLLSEQGDARVLAGIDEAGGICLVGYPAQVTREVLTVVVRELLVLTGRLWRMPLEEFAAVLEQRLGRSLGEHFVGKAAKDWSEAGFRAGLRQSLEQGRFPVVLLLAGTNKDAIEAMAHLKSHGIALKPLGVFLYESWGIEVVVPKVLAIAELGLHEGAEQAKSVPRPAPPPPRMPPRRFQTGQPSVAQIGASEPGQQSGPAPAVEMPWAHQQVPKPAVAPGPAPVGPRPAQSQPVPKPAPAEKPVWDGSMPGVMAGKRPPPKLPDEPQPRKGQDQSRGRR